MVHIRLSRKILRYLRSSVVLLLAGCLLIMVTSISNKSYVYNEDTYQEMGNTLHDDFLKRLIGPVSADDHALQMYLKKHFLLPPSTEKYNLTSSKEYLDRCNLGSTPFIHKHLQTAFGDSNKGFFIEAGALDGQCLSNTLWLEKEKGWTGLLVEPDAQHYMDMVYKKRNAWISNTCLSTNMYASQMKFISMGNTGKKGSRSMGFVVSNDFDLSTEEFLWMQMSSYYHKMFDMQCFPLYSYLYAINVTVVDFLSLDIQGPELKVFLTLPLDKILVRMVIIEDEFNGFDNNLVSTMNAKGFALIVIGGAPDYVFINRNETRLIDKFRPAIIQDHLDAGRNINYNKDGYFYLDGLLR